MTARIKNSTAQRRIVVDVLQRVGTVAPPLPNNDGGRLVMARPSVAMDADGVQPVGLDMQELTL